MSKNIIIVNNIKKYLQTISNILNPDLFVIYIIITNSIIPKIKLFILFITNNYFIQKNENFIIFS